MPELVFLTSQECAHLLDVSDDTLRQARTRDRSKHQDGTDYPKVRWIVTREGTRPKPGYDICETLEFAIKRRDAGPAGGTG